MLLDSQINGSIVIGWRLDGPSLSPTSYIFFGINGDVVALSRWRSAPGLIDRQTDRQTRSGSCRSSGSGSRVTGLALDGRRKEDANVVGRQDSTAKSGKRAHERTLFTPRSGRRDARLRTGGGGDTTVGDDNFVATWKDADNALIILHPLMHTDRQTQTTLLCRHIIYSKRIFRRGKREKTLQQHCSAERVGKIINGIRH